MGGGTRFQNVWIQRRTKGQSPGRAVDARPGRRTVEADGNEVAETKAIIMPRFA